MGLIADLGLWDDDQVRLARDIEAKVEKNGLKLIRVAWSDAHGVCRAKTLTVPVFLGALESGFNTNVATAMLDASGARVFSSFVRGGGVGLDEMTGSPNLTIVPDPRTFRVLPWEPQVGWILCDEHFVTGAPFHFSTRQLLRRQLKRLAEQGMRSVIGLEVEWYLTRADEDGLEADHIGRPGLRGRAPSVRPIEPGFSLHSETNMDRMHGVIAALADAYENMDLPLRSIENEWGPGQLECTFSASDALEAADNLILFRTATRQICRRMGYVASFMARPGLKNYYSSGWHLHQSIVDKSGRNLFVPDTEADYLSAFGKNYLGGLLQHGVASTVFANPTVNAYRRFRANSLAPDRVAWGIDHRGTMLRVLGGPNDPATRIENRSGEPSANPYLYIASQLVTGLHGVGKGSQPGNPETDPYLSDRPMLPKSLSHALDLAEKEPLFSEAFGGLFMDYYLRLKRTELSRFESFLSQSGLDDDGETTTQWEQDEYFDAF